MKNLLYRVKRLENGNYLLEVDESIKEAVEEFINSDSIQASDRRYETATVKGYIPVVYAPNFMLRRALEVSAD